MNGNSKRSMFCRECSDSSDVKKLKLTSAHFNSPNFEDSESVQQCMNPVVLLKKLSCTSELAERYEKNKGGNNPIKDNKLIMERVVLLNRGIVSDCFPIESEQIISTGSSLPEGTLVWARLTRKEGFWPAMIVNEETIGYSACDGDHRYVFWMKDHRVSKVKKKNMLDYIAGISEVNLKKHSNSLWKGGVSESINLFALRKYNIELTMNYNEKVKWLQDVVRDPDDMSAQIKNLQSGVSVKNSKRGINILSQQEFKGELFIPESIQAYLRHIFAQNQEQEEERLVQERKKNPHNFCLVCTNITDSNHPLFTARLCCSCQVDYLDHFFLGTREKGKKKLCVVCGVNPSEHFCDSGYFWAFCSFCIKFYFHLTVNDIMDNWSCILDRNCGCRSARHDKSLIKIKKNWWEKLGKLYTSITNPRKFLVKIYSVIYFQNSSGPGCINIKKFLYKGEEAVINNIDVTTLNNKNVANKTKNLLSDIQTGTTIMLLGSAANLHQPWVFVGENNNYSPDMRLEQVFLEFYDCYRKITEISITKNVQLFWLFETSAAILPETRKRNTRFMNVAPLLVDSKANCGENRYRFIWTNIYGDGDFMKNLLLC